ncbi:MAG: hypothetical protein OEV64_09555 [Desulfobulbaceae bacterium]|nr:hypothetical protein [Desulfobulbaceae bacterium]
MIPRERLDEIFISAYRLIQQDLSELLGKRLDIAEPRSDLLSKKEVLAALEAKSVIATMKMDGMAKGVGFLLVSVRDAISIGGTLLMFPEDEMSEALKAEDYNEELEDAYGEVANIIAGTLTTTFRDEFQEDLRFVRTEQETFLPVEVDPSSATPFPDKIYYIVHAPMGLHTDQLGELLCIVPGAFFHLVEEEESVIQEEASVEAVPLSAVEEPEGGEEILILANDEKEAGFISSVLTNSGIEVKVLGFRDLQSENITERLRCIFLVMKEVGEHGFGMAIRVSSMAPGIPLVAAAPGWTRPLVMQAVRYGIGDILLTPAQVGDVRQKAERYLGK